MKKEKTLVETGNILRGLIELVGLPPTLHLYNNNNYKGGIFKQTLQKFGIILTYTETHLPWQNISDSEIGEFKRHARKLMIGSNTPISL